jgi:hypothetical protein
VPLDEEFFELLLLVLVLEAPLTIPSLESNSIVAISKPSVVFGSNAGTPHSDSTL